jgi:ATP-dependent DNA ligase
MLATLTDEHFSRAGWIFEHKLDGERVLAFRQGKSVRLLSRNRKSCATAYPEVAEAIAAQPLRDFVVGGYSDPKGSRIGFGALLLGYYEDHNLKYAGEVGTGFSNEMLGQLRSKLSRLEQDRKTAPSALQGLAARQAGR